MELFGRVGSVGQLNAVVLGRVNLLLYQDVWGHAVAQLVEALRYKPEGSGFDPRWCNRNFSLT